MSINFFCIENNQDDITISFFKKACKKYSINYVDVNVNNFDITKPLPNTDTNLLYRIATGYSAKQIELHLLHNMNCTTLYTNNDLLFLKPQILTFQKHNIRIPKTITYIPKNKDLLKKYVDYVKGFPLIVKVNGLSHGAGVMKIESLDSLNSVLDYIINSGAEKILLREFIDSPQHARLIVLGNEVVDSILYTAKKNDFRTNVGEPQVEQKKFNKEFEDIAIQSVQILNSEFGGVDLLIGKNNTPYLAEVNMPCYFSRCQITTNTDVAAMIISYLKEKSLK
jgi:RimK family alpha-L-glutamate ligase